MKATLVNPSPPNLHAAAPGGGKPQEMPGAGFARQLSAHAATHVPPAQAARAALAARPDLADRPFGAIVSLLARHQDLPAIAEPEPAPEEPPAGDAVETTEPPIADPVTDETAEVEPEPVPAESPAVDEAETVAPPIADPITDETAAPAEAESATA